MQGLTTAHLARACRIFLTLAYPDGEQSIPEARRVYCALPEDGCITALLDSSRAAVCQVLKADNGDVRGYALRLGSATFPHLKLQLTQHPGATIVFAVDTHDAFPRSGSAAPESHPDYAAWTRLQQANKQLKERIEQAWEQDGLMTFNQLLLRDLEK